MSDTSKWSHLGKCDYSNMPHIYGGLKCKNWKPIESTQPSASAATLTWCVCNHAKMAHDERGCNFFGPGGCDCSKYRPAESAPTATPERLGNCNFALHSNHTQMQCRDMHGTEMAYEAWRPASESAPAEPSATPVSRNMDYEIPELISNLKADIALYEETGNQQDFVDALAGIKEILRKAEPSAGMSPTRFYREVWSKNRYAGDSGMHWFEFAKAYHEYRVKEQNNGTIDSRRI